MNKRKFTFIPGNVVSNIVHSMIVISPLDCSLNVLDLPLVMVIPDVSVDHCTAFPAPQIHGPVRIDKITNKKNNGSIDLRKSNGKI